MFVIKMGYFIVVMLVSALLPVISGSAIPMWEYLNRGEKMSHLYSVFTKQVDDYCAASDDLCRKDLLSHGLNRLHMLSDNALDNMDPYQRGASELIWSNMIAGHRSAESDQSPSGGSTSAPPAITILSDAAASFGSNPLFRDHEDDYSAFTTGFEDVLGNSLVDPSRPLEESSSILNERFALGSAFDRNWVVGPLAVRVKPDGSPVPEDARRPLPVDEDKEEYRLVRRRLPTLQQISALFQGQPPRYQ